MALLKVMVDHSVVWGVWVGKSTYLNMVIMQHSDPDFQSHLMHVICHHVVCISKGCEAVRTADGTRI